MAQRRIMVSHWRNNNPPFEVVQRYAFDAFHFLS